MTGQAERLFELNKLRNSGTALGNAIIASFSSGKGGTGKSFVALNFSIRLAARGKKVLLIDFDLNFSNLNIMMNLRPAETLYHFLKSKLLLKDIIYNYDTNLDLIFGDSGRVDFPEMNEEKSKGFVNIIRQNSAGYDYIVFDNASGLSPFTRAVIESADVNILVTTPEPTSVMDAYVVIKHLKVKECISKKLLVVNKCLQKDDSEKAYLNLKKAAEHFLKTEIEFLGGIDFSKEVMASIQSQEPFCTVFKGNSISIQLDKLVSGFIEYAHMANTGQK